MSGADRSQEAMNPDRWKPTIPAEASYPWPRRRCDENPAADVAKSNEVAEGINGYNARVDAAVNSLLAHTARAAVALVGGCVLFAHLLNVLEQSL